MKKYFLPLCFFIASISTSYAQNAAIPTTPDLNNADDSGHSGSDNITNDATLSFNTCASLSIDTTLRLVRVPHGNAVGTGAVVIGSTERVLNGQNSNCTVGGANGRIATFSNRNIPEGDWDVYVQAIGQGQGWASDAVASGTLRVRVDTTAPTFVKATRVSDNAIDYYLTEGLRALRPISFNETLELLTFTPALAGSNAVTGTSTATERAANFFRINFSEAYATIASGVGKEISIDYAAGTVPSRSLGGAFTDEAGNYLVDHTGSAVNYVPAIEAITLDQSGSHTIRVSDPNAGDTLSAEWKYVDATTDCTADNYGAAGTTVTLTGSDNTARTGPVTYDGSTNADDYVCVKVGDGTDVVYAVSTNAIEENTTPTITINTIEGDDYVNATERPTVEISGTSTNIANGGIVGLSFSRTDITNAPATVTDNSWSYTIPSGQISIIGDVAVTVTASSSEATDVTRTFTIDTRAPVLADDIDDQEATIGTDFSFQIPSGTFTDTNTLTYTSSALTNGLTFATDTWSAVGADLTAGTVTVTVTATDPAGNTATDEFDIVIAAVNAPTDITLSNNTVAENITTVGTFSTTDDVGDTHSYSLVAGTGDEDNGKFTITNNAIAFNSAPNFESPTDLGDTAGDNTYAIRVKTVDQDNEEYIKEFIITVTDVVEAVTFTIDAIADVSISEGVAYTSVTPNISGGTPIGTVTYTFGGDFPASSVASDTTGVVSYPSLDYESPTDADTSNDYEITLTATDEDGNTDEESWTISITDYLELGGVAINPVLWVKANEGITENASNVITAWTDQSPSTEDATPAGNPVLSSNLINFNPSVAFDGTDDSFEFSKANIIKRRDNFTFIAVAGENDALTVAHQHLLGTDQSGGVRITLRAGNIALHRSNVGDAILDPDPPIAQGDIGIVAISRSNESDFATYQDGAEFTKTDTRTTLSYATDATKTYIGRRTGNSERLNGQIAELVVFEDVLSEADLDKVQTHLAIKYGITLDSDVANYVNAAGTSVFENSGTYANDIVGIAKDDTSVLDQRISKSKNSGAILTISTDATFTGVNSGHTDSLTDGQYLIIGNDGGATTTQSTETPGTTTTRIIREWKVENTGSVGSVNLKFDGLDDTYTLHTDADGDFSAGATEVGALNADGEIATTLANGIYFTLSTTTSPNTAPTDITLTLTNTTVDENQTVVGTFSTTDANVGDTHTYSLVAGTGDEDNGKFTLDTSTGIIAFSAAPNHESPTDAGDTANNNTYAIRVKTVDQDSEEYIKEFIITVTDVDETDADLTDLVVVGATVTPAFTSAGITYSGTVESTVASVTVTPTRSHPEATITVGGTAATSGSASTVTLSDGLNAIAVVVTAEDTSVTKTYTINITKTSTATIAISEVSGGYVNDAEDESAVTISGTSVNIVDAQTLSIVITDSGSGSVTKTPAVTTNAWSTTLTSAEMKGLAEGTITVTAAYTGATTVTKTFIYDATVPATPTLALANDTGSSNSDGITSDATVNVTGLETNATWEWTEDGTDGVVDGSGTSFELRSNEGSYNYEVTQTDEAGNSASSITYSYGHDDTAPILSNPISDKTATVGTQFTYSIPSNTFTENGSPPLTYTSSGENFGIIFSSRTWIGTPTAPTPTLSITLTATDVAGNTQTDEFDIVISAANSNPTDIALDNLSVPENTTAVGTFSTTDADVGDTHTYSLVSGQGGDDNGKFTLTTGGVLSFTTAPDFETPTDTGGADSDNGYGIRVQTEDQDGGTWTAIFTITVTDVAEDDVNLSGLEVAGVTISPAFDPAIVAYTATVASTVATAAVTPTVSHPDATVTVGGVAATSGSASTVALVEGSNAISIVVTAENTALTKTYTLNISRGAATNTAPTDISFTDNPTLAIPENTTRVGALEAVDPDVSDVHIFTIVTSGFGPDGDKFTVTPEGVLSFATAPDFENPIDSGANNSYAVQIQVDDQNGGTNSVVFQIAVTNVVEDDATLSSIGITGATLAETFDPDTTTYSATVLNSVTSVRLNPTPSSSAAAATVNGAVPPSNVVLSTGANTITIVVTAEDGTTQKTYTLNITRGTTPTIIINEVSGGYVNNAEDESAVTISGTSANIADAQTIDLTFSDSTITATTASVSGNTWSTTIPSAEIKAATEGTITVTASYTRATNATQTFVYDRTAPAAPTLSVIETGIGSITNNPTVTVAGLEANATWEYRIEFSGWTAGTGTTFNATEGTADTHVRQTDQAGNVSGEGAIFSLLYDGTLPVLAMEIPDQTATVGTDFSFEIPPGTFTDANQIGYSSSGEGNGISFATRTWSGVGADLTAGTLTITVTATDVAGNIATDEFDIVISAATPTSTWTGTDSNDWSVAANWSGGVPTPTHNVSIPKTDNQPTATAAVTVNKVTMAAGASLMANDAFTGDITYNREISHVNGNEEGWYLMASPVVGQTYDATYVTTNGIALSSSNLGIGTHNTSTNDWTYLQSTGSGTFVPGQGYAIKRAAAGTISFTGTLNVDNVDVVLATTGDRFNLLGNPYPSYLNSADFLANTAIDDTQTLWVWSHDPAGSGGRGTYNVKTSTNAFIVAPGQGFFVRANTGGGTFNFSETNQSHNTTDTFQKSQTTQVKLDISDGAIERYCEIYYSPETTTGFDVGYDGELFSGAPNPFAIYTHLVSDSEGKHYQIQSLPYSDIENMVIPVGINAVSGREITITADVTNFPAGVHLYLEDKLENSFTQLSKSDAKYTVTLSDNLEGIGRFFLRASSSDLNDFSTSLENISVYTSSKNNLRIVGIQDGDVKLRAYNILGAQIIDTSFKGNGKNDVAIPSLAAGIYIVHLEMATGKVSKKNCC